MKKINIPNYSLSEEIINSITHGVGVLFGIVVLVLTTIKAAKNGNTIGIISSCIYGSSMIIMYLVSCLYHAFSPKKLVKKIFRIIDHCDIYVYIAGCYTPFCLSLIGGKLGWLIFIIIWSCAVIGVLLNAIDLEKYNKISFVLYLVMGWLVVLVFNNMIKIISIKGIFLLLFGGIIYTVGSLLYCIGAKKKYFHSIFHFFVLLGSLFQFFSILFYAI